MRSGRDASVSAAWEEAGEEAASLSSGTEEAEDAAGELLSSVGAEEDEEPPQAVSRDAATIAAQKRARSFWFMWVRPPDVFLKSKGVGSGLPAEKGENGASAGIWPNRICPSYTTGALLSKKNNDFPAGRRFSSGSCNGGIIYVKLTTGSNDRQPERAEPGFRLFSCVLLQGLSVFSCLFAL